MRNPQNEDMFPGLPPIADILTAAHGLLVGAALGKFKVLILVPVAMLILLVGAATGYVGESVISIVAAQMGYLGSSFVAAQQI